MKGKIFSLIAVILLLVSYAEAADTNRQIKSRLGIAVPYLVTQLEPLAINEPVTKVIFGNISHSLLRIDGGELVTDLAVSYRSLEDGLAWEVVMPREVPFADGSSLRGESIVKLYEFFSNQAKSYLNRQRTLPLGVPEKLLRQLVNIKSVSSEIREVGNERAIEQEVVTFRLHKVDEDFRRALILPILDMRVVDSFAADRFSGTNISALGPFELSVNAPEQGMSLSKVNNYFKLGLPQLSSIEIRQTVDAEQALSALRVGSVDIILMPTAKILEQVEKDPTLIAIDSPLGNLKYQSAAWQLMQPYWSESNNPQDKLVLDKIVIRKSLSLDQSALTRLDLSNVYLP